MALQNTRDMLNKASEADYAVPAFNFHNLETALTIIQAAVKTRSPLILAVSPRTVSYAGLEYVHAIANTAAKKHDNHIALHLDYHESCRAIEPVYQLVVKSVMIDG